MHCERVNLILPEKVKGWYYLFDFVNGVWQSNPSATMNTPSNSIEASFGFSVHLATDQILVGAPGNIRMHPGRFQDEAQDETAGDVFIYSRP